MPAGGLFAKWNEGVQQAVWYWSTEREFVFLEPACAATFFVERDRARFRSCIFRLATLCGDDLNGSFAFLAPNGDKRKFVVRSAFYPEAQIGLWVAITTTDQPLQIP
jgi:hypothetical protein